MHIDRGGKSCMLLAIKQGRDRLLRLNIHIKRFDDQSMRSLFNKFLTWTAQGYPTINQTIPLEFIYKRKIAVRQKRVYVLLVICTWWHRDKMFKWLQSALEYRPFARPING